VWPESLSTDSDFGPTASGTRLSLSAQLFTIISLALSVFHKDSQNIKSIKTAQFSDKGLLLSWKDSLNKTKQQCQELDLGRLPGSDSGRPFDTVAVYCRMARMFGRDGKQV
jgi:hypothetical protein